MTLLGYTSRVEQSATNEVLYPSLYTMQPLFFLNEKGRAERDGCTGIDRTGRPVERDCTGINDRG